MSSLPTSLPTPSPDSSSLVLKSLPTAVSNESISLSSSILTAPNSVDSRWSPYISNEGTVVGVAGEDFCIIGGDTRMSDGYTILSRDVSKIHELTPFSVIATGGMQAEAVTLRKVLDIRVQQYKQRHHKEISTPAIAQLLSNTLYGKRFFPYYTFNILGGIDSNGKGCCFGYDAIGSFERIPYGVTGSASALITSLFDNQYAFKTQLVNKKNLSIEETVDLVKDAFTAAGERDIYTGDSVNLAIITKDGIKYEKFDLKKD